MKQFRVSPDFGNPRHSLRGQGGDLALAGAVLELAIREMRTSTNLKDRVSATIWLGSTQATYWFEVMGLEQDYALENMNWPKHASDLLADPELVLPVGVIHMLQTGIDALHHQEENV